MIIAFIVVFISSIFFGFVIGQISKFRIFYRRYEKKLNRANTLAKLYEAYWQDQVKNNVEMRKKLDKYEHN